MNNCTFVGRFAADPEVVKANDTHVVNFTLAIEEFRRDTTGAKKKRVDFLSFEAWDSGATTIGKFCKKGDMIVVNCSAREQQWESEDGKKKSRVNFRVNQFKLIGGKHEVEAGEE